MKNQDTKKQSTEKQSAPAVNEDSGVRNGNSSNTKWDHSSANISQKSGSGTGKSQDRKSVGTESDDGYQDAGKRKFSSTDSESKIDKEGYSSPSRSSKDESFSEDESGSSPEQKSSSLDKDEEE